MSETNADQREFWTDQAGPIWVAQMQAMDIALAPVLDAVLSQAEIAPGKRVLDIGCGAGTSTIEVADRVGAEGSAVGIDISETLLAVANARIGGRQQLSFLEADAQTHPFAPGAADLILSRFGVMFFEDFPTAFANLRSALRPGGRLALGTWGAIPGNPYFTLPAAIAKEMLGPVPKTDPDLPGPFALRDPARVKDILRQAGFDRIEVEERHIPLTPPGPAAEVAELLCEIGPAQRALTFHEASAAQRAALCRALADALTEHETPDGIRIPALINIITAREGA